jgi:hypothetical protein
LPVPDRVAFGKLPKKSDPRTLLLSFSLPDGLLTRREATADDVRNDDLFRSWGELGNKQHQDCAIAAAGHAEMLWAAKYHEQRPYPTTTQILDAYSKITGYDPNDPTTDKGADLLSVLKYWKKTGIAGQRIGAFAEILPRDTETLKWAIDALGVAYVGLRLPVATAAPKAGGIADFTAPRQLRRPATWRNPLYGHCVIYAGYRPDQTFRCVSWGKVMTVSEEFHLAYCDEAYAIISPGQVHSSVAPANLDAAELDRAVWRLKSVPGR